MELNRTMIMQTKAIIFSLLILLLCACKGDKDDITFPATVELGYDFQADAQAWEGDFADYPVGQEGFYELSYAHATLPAPLDSTLGALRQSGNNHSDDLFMFVHRRITGLEPNRDYQLSFEIEFASNVADGLFGVGGSPGESVYLKAGASALAPEKIVEQSDYRMNIDKGNQSVGGSAMKVVGDFSNDTNQSVYTLKSLVARDLLIVSTNSRGELWLIVGTDSGFEATTTIYYNAINVTLEKQ